MARKALPLFMIVAIPFLAGCGGGDVAYEEVKLPPPALTIPKDTGTSTTSASSTATPTPTATPTATAGGTSSSGTSSGTTSSGTTGSTGGTAGTTGGAGTQTTTQPQDTGGATADQGLDQFCADNPGACDGGTQNP
jgi:hypothetical protein